MRMDFRDVRAVVQPIGVDKFETVRVAQDFGAFDSETLQVSRLNLGSGGQPDRIPGGEIEFQISIDRGRNLLTIEVTAGIAERVDQSDACP